MQTNHRTALMVAGLMSAMSTPSMHQAIHAAMPRIRMRKPSKIYHPMVTASPAEIAAWNEAVTTRQVMRRKNRPARIRRAA